ncbi:glycosyltransferase family 4 protein [Phormidium sp. CLA17]|uniref:glycosyltransferase family 4 protein n=1 Tax=Leptolyngbya sp. Cla-17 TaxID=2803751 RepID=UPI00149297BF|nr:glycosyltransferase family 4 protein [Leptolyngbya sp. Cla-17]MBM0741372.1 glycosyltransferase family 4 protein [Leptolyngbya sp. Cla-17]
MAKIAFISTMDGSPWGGSEYLWAAAAKQALKDGHEVLVSLHDWSEKHSIVSDLTRQGAQLFLRPRNSKSSIFFRAFRRASQSIPSFIPIHSKSLYQSLFDLNPDAICISQSNSFDVSGQPDLLNLLYSSSIPFTLICQLNGDAFSLKDSARATVQKLFTQAAVVAFVSRHNLTLAERQLAQTLPQATVVQNPVNLTSTNPVPFPDQSTAKFACVARLETTYKGQDALFEVLSSPEWKERHWLCSLYGSGPDRAYLEALAKYYGISDRIQFAGHVNDIRSVWAENHLLVLPSRSEGTPLALVESMLCGRPAVVTDVGGNAEWIQEGTTGFIAEAPTMRSLSAALERAWLAQDKWILMGETARAYAINRRDAFPGKSLLNLIVDTINP